MEGSIKLLKNGFDTTKCPERDLKEIVINHSFVCVSYQLMFVLVVSSSNTRACSSKRAENCTMCRVRDTFQEFLQ